MNLKENQQKQNKDLYEDFSLINPQEINDPVKFFHKMIRQKYFNRIQKDYQENQPQNEHFKGFLLVKSTFDHYQFYNQNFTKLQDFNKQVEVDLVPILIDKIRKFKQKKIELQFKNKLSKSQLFKREVCEMIEEFKLQIDLLIDSFDKTELYNLLEEQNFKKINKFGINYDRLQDIMIPFFLSKFFGQLNQISSQLFVKVFISLVSKMINVNISTWSVLLPEINLFKEENWLSEKLEQFVFSKFFDIQKKQLLFLFGNLNTTLNEQNLSIQKQINTLYKLDRSLEYDYYLEIQENINIKFKELKEFKFPEKKNQTLNLNQIRNIVNINLKEEFKEYNQQQKYEAQKEDYHGSGSDDVCTIQNFDIQEVQQSIRLSQQPSVDFYKVEQDDSDIYDNNDDSDSDENLDIEENGFALVNF